MPVKEDIRWMNISITDIDYIGSSSRYHIHFAVLVTNDNRITRTLRIIGHLWGGWGNGQWKIPLRMDQ